MGRWGSNVISRGRWDVEGFEAQTAGFVTGVTDGFVGFSYQGQRTAEIARGITVEDAAWFYSYAGRLTAPGLRGGLAASGAIGEEAARFARALLDRIQQIGRAAGCPTAECTSEDSTGPAEPACCDPQQGFRARSHGHDNEAPVIHAGERYQ